MAQKERDKMFDYREIPLEMIEEPKGQIRLEINQEGIVELAENIEEQGLYTPILVRKNGKMFEIVQGHRRYLAFKFLKAAKIPAKVSSMDDLKVALARATENIFREDISPIEEGAVYKDLQDNHGLSPEDISRRMKRPISRVKRRMDFLEMPACLQKAIHEKSISASVGEELWKLGNEMDIEYYLSFAIDNGVTRNVARQWVQDHAKKLRTREQTGEGGSPLANPYQGQKFYGDCNVCHQPVEYGKEINLRLCPACYQEIEQAMKG